MSTARPLALAALLLSLAACSADAGTAPTASGAPPATPPASPAPTGTPPATSTATPTATTSPAATVALPVYWLGSAANPTGPLLYREWHSRPADADPVEAAVQTMLAGQPQDPDYTSLWAEDTRLRSVARDGSTAVVDLSAQARTNGGGSAFEARTLQQLVHTVTAADPSVSAVRLHVEGRPVETLWGSVGTDRPLRREPAVEVLAPVWIDVPQGGTVTDAFGGTASVFEATVDWDVRQAGRVVQEGFSTATVGAPERGEWTAELDVPPGDYELRAWETSARDGSVTFLDTKDVTVAR